MYIVNGIKFIATLLKNTKLKVDFQITISIKK